MTKFWVLWKMCTAMTNFFVSSFGIECSYFTLALASFRLKSTPDRFTHLQHLKVKIHFLQGAILLVVVIAKAP